MWVTLQKCLYRANLINSLITSDALNFSGIEACLVHPGVQYLDTLAHEHHCCER